MNARPSNAQLETLMEYMEQHPQFARGQMRNTKGRYETKVQWDELTKILNSIGVQKTPKQWIRFWADKKYKIKIKVAQRNAAAHHQRCGLHPMPKPLSDLEGKILHVVGGDESCSTMTESSAPRKMESAQPGPASPVVSHKGSQTDDTSLPRRSSRIRVRRQRSQVTIERQRLINIKEKRVAAETAQAHSFRKAVMALDNLARAVIQCGQSIADSLNNRVSFF